MLIDIYMKFIEDIMNRFQFTVQTQNCVSKFQGKLLVDICMKFHDACLYGLKVIERTRWRQDFVRDKVQSKITKKI